MVHEQEGVIKFKLDYESGPPSGHAEAVRTLSAWRRLMVLAGLMGQAPDPYDGYGFGNISCRVPPYYAPPRARLFLISGTQTGRLSDLGPEHYALVSACAPRENRVCALGPVLPSSESMTHGAVYAQDPGIRFVIHGHSPDIWGQARVLGLPVTREDVPYGTPEMAREVQRLFHDTDVRRLGVFAMGGHLDGIVAFGATAREAGAALMDCLARAFAAGG